jgi:oligopeptide transport system permease protein
MGGAISLLIGMSAAGLALLIGVSWGMIAGYFGGVIDGLMMRIVDVIYGLPYLLMVVLLSMGIGGIVDGIDAWSLTHEQAAAEAGRSYRPLGLVTMLRDYGQVVNVLTLVLAIGLVSWLTMARVIRGQVLSLRSQPFIEATRALGLGTPRVLTRHLLPNLLGPIVVYATLAVPQAILQESFLSFLGIGVRAPLPSWGNLAAEGVEELPALVSPELSMNWWLVVFPCLLLGLTLLGLNFAGDALRERFDPRGRR